MKYAQSDHKEFHNLNFINTVISYSKIFGLAPVIICNKNSEIIFKSSNILRWYSLIFLVIILGIQYYLFKTMGNIEDFLAGTFVILLDVIICFITSISVIVVTVKNCYNICEFLNKMVRIERKISYYKTEKLESNSQKLIHFVWMFLNLLLVYIIILIMKTNPYEILDPAVEACFFYICYLIPGIYVFQFSGYVLNIIRLQTKLLQFLKMSYKSFEKSAKTLLKG